MLTTPRPSRPPGSRSSLGVDAARTAGRDLLRGQLVEPSPLRQRRYRDRPGSRRQMRVIEGVVHPGQAVHDTRGLLFESAASGMGRRMM